ncbi:MAG: DNA polymerase III subunit alpha [Betaproteobacteria bacterium]|nr:DNA polymerase III subunit alpha [Betaproteobacteria bacterium]
MTSASPAFVHLRLHSEYSISDGIVRIDDAVEKAVAGGMPALALTDLSNVFGLVKFYQAARTAGIKPLVGCDLWLSSDKAGEKPTRFLLLCQNRPGYLRLCELLSRAFRVNQHRGHAEVLPAWFDDLGTEGLIALSGAAMGDVGQWLAAGNAKTAKACAKRWGKWFPNRFYLEIQRTGAVGEETQLQQTLALASELRLPVAATHPVQFLERDDYRAHEARVCISAGYILSDQRRPRTFTEEQYFKSQAEMTALFADVPSALANSVEIAKRCSFILELGKSQLPRFPTPQGIALDDFFGAEARRGLEDRMLALFPDEQERLQETARYRERLETEIATINKMGFAGYFLIVADFIQWAKHNGVPVGPGRGSGAGSLVAYSLSITDLDPLRYGLLFERFLNPERVSMPDFDIDFCQDGRERVIDYVRAKYGADSVSQIATFGTMAAKAVVRDVGRVMDLPYNFCDQLAKLIPFQPGKLITLKMAREMEPLLAEREKKEEEVRELLELAGRLEGLTRNVGMHAGGVLIAPGKLTDFCPLYCAEGAQSIVSQLDKDDVEAVGLVKFDFLGLTTLTVLDWTLRFIARLASREGGVRREEGGVNAVELLSSHLPPSTSLEKIPLNDSAAYRIFATGNTTAVFQFESRGMRDLVKRAKPDRFEDIIALVALFRPGPMELIPDFIERKHGRQRVEYLDPRLEPILGETYGIMVYQEQVMQIAQVMGGYSLGSADLLRRAMGKKKPEEMALQREIFVAGALKNGLTQGRATQLFDLMEKFAGYGFNKSHAAAYALVAYQTAYLKVHHGAAFMAANLSAVMDDTDKVHQFHDDAKDNDLVVLPPDINASDYRFVPVSEKEIRYGLGAMKGTGESAIMAIAKARKDGGAFKDLFDFCRRVDRRVVNRRALESLIRGGAFDALNPDRASLLASAGMALEHAERSGRTAHQNSLFGQDAALEEQDNRLIQAKPWSEKERLQHEKQALGYYLSGHPYSVHAGELGSFIRTSLGRLQPQTQSVLAAGVIGAMRVQQTRRGRMVIVQLDDGSGRIEVSIFNELFEAHRSMLKEDQLLIVEGRPALDEFTGGVRMGAEKLFDLSAARNHFAKGMRLQCNGQSSGSKLRDLLAPYRGGKCPVFVAYNNHDAQCEIDLGEQWRVSLQDELVQALGEWLSPANVQIRYQ